MSKSKLIMVFNDTADILELFEILLTTEGYTVSLHSYSSRELYEVKQTRPDLIISDHPIGYEKEGWQFIQKLKMDRETATIPLIICTANRKVVEDIGGILGAKGVLIIYKPFDIDELLEAVKTQQGKLSADGRKE